MPSHSSFIYKIIGIGLMFLCLLSCAPKPELEWIPEIKSVSAKVTDNTCVLTAEISAELAGGYDCGFLYGKTKDNMRRVKASADGKKFNFILESLDYDTDYVYRAYVSNGRNEICSEVSYFRILKEKETPKSMTLPFNTIEVGAKESEFLVDVGGEADFTVNIPDTVAWVFYRRDNRTCRFQVKANPETDVRRCDVVFTNLSDNQSDTLSVVQEAKANEDNLPEYLKEVPYCSSTFGVSLPGGLLGDIRLLPDGERNTDWVRWDRTEESEFTRLDFYFDENPTDEERTCNLIISYDGGENFLTIVQKYAGGIITFEDPLVKQACVEAFDLDADGELSYYEAAMPDNIENLNFYLTDIKSFDEFQWFVNVKEIHSMIFTESKIESIKFPYAFSILEGDAFAACRELSDIDLSDIVVRSSFVGCSSLEYVKAKIVDGGGFMECDGLKTAVQQTTGIPAYAFCSCDNLRSVKFEITDSSSHCIGYRAFDGCSRLLEITIPEDITEIHDDAFRGCISLSRIYMESLDPPSLGENVFLGTNEYLEIYVPYESLYKYQEAWPSVSYQIEPQDPERVLMILPAYRDMSFQYHGGYTSFKVMGDAPFEVDVPSAADWLDFTCAGKRCALQAKPNNTSDERRCELIFRNLSTGQHEVISVRQSGIPVEETNLPFDKIYASYESKVYTFMLPEDKFTRIIRMPYEDNDWLSYFQGRLDNSVHISVHISENTTKEDRIGHLLIDYDGRNNALTVIQKADDSIIEFKDPVVKNVCVDAFDRDGDGELACWEAASVTGNGLDILDFSGMEITSFDELCWFTNLVEINMPIFAGSHLESVVLPFDIIMRGGVFENCTELKTVGLNCCNVADGVFKGCSGLKNVDVKYVGNASFEDCTGLETVTLRSALVSPSAFRNCTSLRLFEFSGEGSGDCYICEEAFAGCTSLPEITVISQITQIHDRAFYGCSSLSSVYMESSVPPTLGEDVFAGTHPSLKIYVRPEVVARYKAVWPSLAHRIVSADDPGGEILPQEGDYVDEYGINHGPGIKIGETVWAPVNCGYHATDFKYGKLYQWGRKYGQGYNGNLWDVSGNSIGEYSDAFVSEQETGPVDLATGQSSSNSNKFYYNSSSPYDWCSSMNDELWNSGNEENPVKTEYDPCPVGWRVPTDAELDELNNNYSSWTTDDNGQSGRWFSGPNSYTATVPQVFFPAAGYSEFISWLRGAVGKYWSSRPSLNASIYITFLSFGNSYVSENVGNPRQRGQSVRCVQDDTELIPVSSVTLSKTSLSLSAGASETLSSTITPSNANHQSAHWWSDNPEIASVDQNGNVAGVSGGATIIYAMAGMQVATCSVTVTGTSNPGDYIDEYGINHGPGVKIGETVWAPVNCGYHATDFKYGKLYQWGRRYGQGYDGPICDEEGYHIGISSDISEPELVDGPVSLAEGQSESNADIFYCEVAEMTGDWCTPSDDRLWNSGTEVNPVKAKYDPCPYGWRVPTLTELSQLTENYSSWTTDENGQKGYWFCGATPYTETVPQVFFPAAGERISVGVDISRDSYGYYWSSSPYPCDLAFFAVFYSGDAPVDSKHAHGRASGCSVRCVQATDEVAEL